MSTSCVLHPRLSNGEKSPLFSRLKNFLGDRKSAEDVYYRAINPSFREAFPNVRFDHNGEPLLEDLITQCGIGHSKSNEAMLNFLNSEYGTKPVPRTMQSAIELQNRAASFNINSPLNKKYSAELTSSRHDVSMEIVTATGNERDLGKQQRFNAELNNQLVKLLNSWGADVAALTELEEASNINGVMDLSAGINAATGLKEVIRISRRHRWSNVSKKENILTDEEQEILNNAPRNSQGKLLAPNGKVSNLTERQYAQVRTKAFKDWFGDWENNPSEASKVVDENGEPLVVYHNTPFEFNGIFDMDHKSRIMPWTSEPFGHVGTQETANTIKGTQFALFLNVRNPLETPDFVHETVSSMLSELYKQGIISREKYSSLRGISNSELRKLMLSLGYDGTKYENKAEGGGISYSFISPNQIKLADGENTTFSRTNDNIHFFKDSKGVVYGYVDNAGIIHLNKNKIRPEHPIHEYTHIWDRVVALKNPSLWIRGVELMK